MNTNTKNPRLISALLVLLTASASQAALTWLPDAMSPNGEFTTATTPGSAISYGVMTLCDGTMQDYAVVFNDAFDLRYVNIPGNNTNSLAVNNAFSVHTDGSADLYTAINDDGYVDISVFTYALGSYNAGTNTGTPLVTNLGVTAPNQSPDTETGSDMLVGNNVNRLNNREELFSTTAIAALNSPGDQIESLVAGHPTNLTGGPNGTDGIGTLPTGFPTNGAWAWEASTGLPSYGANGTLQVGEADFNVTYAPTSQLRLRRETDTGQNSAFGFAAAVFDEPIPEPSSALLLMAGLVAFAGGLRRQR